MHLKFSLIVCAGIVLLSGMAEAAPNSAILSDQLNQLSERAAIDPIMAQQMTMVVVETDPGTSVKSDISAVGGVLRYHVGRRHEVTMPAGRLSHLLARLPPGSLVRFPYPHRALAVTSQGVALTGAADMQAVGTNGNGIKVGIIDLGFANLASAQASGDLPADLSVVDYSGSGATTGTDHGTNVAQIVYDVVPGAQLYLAKIATDVQLQQAVTAMIAAGVRVINHSVGWFGAAFYDGTGPLCTTVNQAEANNVQWVNAMGNDRLHHYMALLTDANNDRRHEFSAGQNYDTVNLTAGVAASFILNWDAYSNTTNIDYDLYLYNGNPDAGGVIVAKSENRQSVYPYPYEDISYTPSTSGTYYVVVRKYRTNTPNVRFALFSLDANLSIYTTASSLAQPADCPYVVGVGATDLSDNAEYFSSEGPTTDGRAKPDIAAPDRVQTSLTSVFAGTSASSPHACGAVALLMAQNPGMTTTQIRWLLTATAKDVYTAGYDYRTGSGRISLDADKDGYSHDSDNCRLVSNPDQADMDRDGVGDACDDDIDGDGLTNTQEIMLGTNPRSLDTDNDGLTDRQEVNVHHTNPLLADTDGDGLNDGMEVNTYGTNPLVSDKGHLAPSTGGNVTVADLMMLMRFVEGLSVPNAKDLILGDMNNDQVLDVRDVLLLRRQLGF